MAGLSTTCGPSAKFQVIGCCAVLQRSALQALVTFGCGTCLARLSREPAPRCFVTSKTWPWCESRYNSSKEISIQCLDLLFKWWLDFSILLNIRATWTVEYLVFDELDVPKCHVPEVARLWRSTLPKCRGATARGDSTGPTAKVPQ